MSRAWDNGLRYSTVGDNLSAIGHGVPGSLYVLPTPNVPPVRDMVCMYHKITDTELDPSLCFQPCQRRAVLWCKRCPYRPVECCTHQGEHLAHTPWMLTCMVGEGHFAQSGVVRKRCVKASDAATLIGDRTNTAANSPRPLDELGRLKIDRHRLLRRRAT